MTRRIGILAPMPSELRPVVKSLGLTRRVGDDGVTAYRGTIGDATVVASGTGIGPHLAAAATGRLLAMDDVDLVVVCGIAGGIEGACRVGDLVRPVEVVDGADGTRFRATAVGDVPLAGVIRTGDADSYRLTDDDLDRLRAEGVVALDMETAAVARVCEAHRLPWMAVRGISDMAGDDTVGEEVLTLVHPDGSPDVRAAVRFLARNPGRIPRMVRLGRESGIAARRAAEEVARLLGRP